MSDCNHHHCKVGAASDLVQSLDELDFERGIWSAALAGDLERVRKKIDDVNRGDNAGYSALHYAARSGNFEVCKFLLDHGANINATTKAGNASALHRAASAGNYDIVELLVNRKADVMLQDADGKTALHRAAESKRPAIYEFLKNRAPELEAIADHKSKLPSDYYGPYT